MVNLSVVYRYVRFWPTGRATHPDESLLLEAKRTSRTGPLAAAFDPKRRRGHFRTLRRCPTAALPLALMHLEFFLLGASVQLTAPTISARLWTVITGNFSRER
jgi:hypothetical protein